MLCCWFAIATLSAPGNAHAQWAGDATLDLGAGYGQIALSQAALDGTRRLGRAADRAVALPPASRARRAEPVAALDFMPSADVTRRVLARFAAQQVTRHPHLRDDLEKAWRESRELDVAQRRMLALGLWPRDLADVTALYFLTLWEIDTGRSPSGAQIGAVQRQFRRTMGADAELAALDGAARQEIADTLAVHAALLVQGYESLRGGRDPATLANFRRGIRTRAVPNGPDIAGLRLTDAGFIRP